MIDTPKIPIDLHCHSLHSDGAHSVEFVLNLVKQNGGKYIALTDHDTVCGISDAKNIAKLLELNLIIGVEISVTWNNNTLIHIVGLGVDETNPALINNLATLRSFRYNRGQKIAHKLNDVGIPNALAGALQYCADPNSLSRTHFARFLVDNGYAKSNRVFDKFLVRGAPAYVPQEWAKLEDAVSWITNSGGVAVIAHPARYNLTRTKLQEVIDAFKACGGMGIEVISSSHTDKQINEMAVIADKNQLYASVGSDFHKIDGYPKVTVGINKKLPIFCTPIFNQLGINDYEA